MGKTAVSIRLAHKLQAEIVSADSMQVFRYLDIGTAKPTRSEREGIPHHLIDVVNPDEKFTVFDYQKMAQEAIYNIYEKGKYPILTGGTGLYIKSVLDQYAFTHTPSNLKIRSALQQESQVRGKVYLYEKLKKVDPDASNRIHPNDIRRITRALEYFLVTGEPISRQWELTKDKESPYHIVMVGLSMSRPLLYERIEKRVDQMLATGLLDEVKKLLKSGFSGHLKPLQSLGYRHMINYLESKWNLDEAVNYFKQDTRKYAKRQLTWFRADARINWIEIDPEKQLDPVLEGICLKIEGN